MTIPRTPALVAPSDLAPLTTRLDVVGVVRVVAALATLLLVPLLPHIGGSRTGGMALLTTAYLAVTAGAEHLRRRVARRSVSAIQAVLAVDAVFIGLVVARTGGHQGPLVFLVYLHVVAVTLLVSYRVGLRVAVLHAGLLLLGWCAADAAVFGVPSRGSNGTLSATVLNAGTFLVVAGGAAICSSVNERALRSSRSDLADLVELGESLERVETPELVVAACTDHVADRLGFRRVVTLVRDGSRWWGTSRDGAVRTEVEVASATDVVDVAIAQAWADGSALVRTLDPRTDATLDALLPGAENLVVIPVTVEGNHLGVVVAEGGGTGAHIAAPAVEAVTRAAAHTGLSLRSALLLRKVEELATRDTLTGLANRRLFEESLIREVGRAHRDRTPLSLLIMDLDHFKSVNDEHGHQAGDEVLRQVGAALAATCRTMDLPARYGGEEFVVLLPDCAADAAAEIAERLRSSVADGVSSVAVTTSVGIATLPDNALDADRLVAAADDALYDAKGAGRDRCTVSSRRAPGAPTVGQPPPGAAGNLAVTPLVDTG